MKSFRNALVLAGVLASTNSHGQDVAQAWACAPAVVADTVQVRAPKIASTARPTDVTVLIGAAAPCARIDVRVDHRDEFTHVVIPQVQGERYPCVQVSRFHYQKLSLGMLRPGEHRVLVENASRPVAPATFWVADDISVAAE